MNTKEFIDMARLEQDLGIAIERIFQDNLKVTPTRIVKYSCLTMEDVSQNWDLVCEIYFKLEEEYDVDRIYDRMSIE